MKKIALLMLLSASATFAQAPEKSKVTFTAKIENRNSDTLKIYGPNQFLKVIPIKNGVFKASFETIDGLHQFSDGNESSLIFLKGGDNLQLIMDAKEFDESIIYKGEGAIENNYLAQKALSDEKFQMTLEELMTKEEAIFTAALTKKKEADLVALSNNKLNSKLIAALKPQIEQEAIMYTQFFNQKKAAAKLIGTASPTFNYENHKGGTTSLESLKGKYVYIDVWATWCGPCRAEIPYLKKVEEAYHGKNIEFVSISIDNAKDHEKWTKFVAEKELGGVQLFADNDWNSQFVKEYKISGIPRFILVGPNGEIVNADAPRPSSAELVELFDAELQK
jgi:thiol-disulfide isomerase/thioredoxin